MKAGEIAAVLEQWAPLGIQEQWDNSGLVIGDSSDEVRGVLVGLDCTPELMDEAIRKGCDMVVTHHPLIFRGVKRIGRGDPVSEAIRRAVENGIVVYAAHTNADKVLEGVSGAMARRLDLRGVTPLLDEGGYGLGAVGDLPEPLSGEETLRYVARRFGLGVIRHSAPVPRIHRVAVLGGSGAGEMDLAWKEGAQLYISADISYHHFFLPEGVMVMDIGHFESEVEITDIFFSLIRKNFPTFAVRVSEALGGSNPVRYYVVK